MCKEHCGGAHPAYECRKKSTAAMMESPSQKARGQSALNATGAGTQALPVDTNSSARLLKGSSGIGLASPAKVLDAEAANIKDAHTPKRGRGRPRTITDMKVYKAMKQREYRARKK